MTLICDTEASVVRSIILLIYKSHNNQHREAVIIMTETVVGTKARMSTSQLRKVDQIQFVDSDDCYISLAS